MVIRNKKGQFVKGLEAYPKTQEQREKARQRMLGTHMSKETKKKLSDIGKTKTGEKSNNWRGGRRFDTDGYIQLYMPEHPNCDNHKCIKEHRYIMEQHIGRYLNKGEIVHHKNCIRHDNRIENLQLFANMNEHINYHRFHIKYWSSKGCKHSK
jgi:hypothetical protein